jgi:hypothetical protein
MTPSSPMAMECGLSQRAAEASPPFPELPGLPSAPDTVLTTPVVSILRTTWLPPSATNALPAPSSATSVGLLNRAEVRKPPSPLDPLEPQAPAHVAMDAPGVVRMRMQCDPVTTT